MPLVGDTSWVGLASSGSRERVAQSSAAPVTSALRPSQGTQLLVIIITVSTVIFFVIGLVVWSVYVRRQRHTEHETDMLETDPETKLNGHNLEWKRKYAIKSEVKQPLVLPEIIVTSSYEDPRTESRCGSDVFSSDRSEDASPSLEDDHFAEVNTRMFTDEDFEVANSSSASLENDHDSFFSDEMLGELSTIATTLKEFSTVDSFDIKAINSERSSIIIEHEYEVQEYSAEDICESTEQVLETLGTVLLELETMADTSHYCDEPNLCSEVYLLYVESEAFISKSSKAVSTTLYTIAEVSMEDLSCQSDDTPALSYAVDESESTLETSPASGFSLDSSQVLGLDNAEAFSTSTPKKVSSSDSGVDILGALESPTAIEDSANSTGSNNAVLSRFPSRPRTRTVIPNVPRFVPFIDPPRISRHEMIESDTTLPSPSRSPLGDIKSSDSANTVPRAPHPVRRVHARTSSRDKLQNFSKKRAMASADSVTRMVSARHFR